MKLIPAGDLTSANPVLAVRWCLSAKEVEELKKRNALHPHVLFITVYAGGSEDRQLVPLDQMLAYLTFRRPGNHSVFAKVIWPQNHLVKPKVTLEKRVYAQFSSRRYEYQLLNNDMIGFAKHRLNYWDMNCLRDTRRMDVVVPKEHFPKEPPVWLKRIVNFGFEYPAVDQCQFRGRLWGLALKLPLFGCWAVITTVIRAVIALFFGFFGSRDINFGAIIHPWRDDISDVHRYANLYDTWFRHTKDRSRRRSRWIYLLHPLPYSLMFAALTIVKVHYRVSYEEAFVMVAGKIGLIAIAAASALVRFALDHIDYVAVVLVACIGLAFFWTPLFTKKDQAEETQEEFIARRKKQEQVKLRAEQERDREYNKLGELLACNAHVAPELSALPPDRQTVRLRFLDLKAKVCRPFAA